MESAEKTFRPSQMNRVIARVFPDGVLSLFVEKPTENDENPIPLTFNPETAGELKQFIFGYDNSYNKNVLSECLKKNEELAKQLAKANHEVTQLSNQLELYKDKAEKIKDLQVTKSEIIKSIDQLKPNTRIYVCKNGVQHNDEIVVDTEEIKEEFKRIVNERL